MLLGCVVVAVGFFTQPDSDEKAKIQDFFTSFQGQEKKTSLKPYWEREKDKKTGLSQNNREIPKQPVSPKIEKPTVTVDAGVDSSGSDIDISNKKSEAIAYLGVLPTNKRSIRKFMDTIEKDKQDLVMKLLTKIENRG